MHYVLLLTTALALAVEPPPRPKAIREIAETALSAPPELAADILLRLVESGKIADAKWKRELVETSWGLARHATFRTPVLSAVNTHTDTDIAHLMAALSAGVTTSSLQTRIVNLIQISDRIQARELFFEMERPTAESLSCATAGFSDHEPFFRAVDLIAQGFSAQERAEGKRTTFLMEAMRAAATPQDFVLTLDLLQQQQTLDNQNFAALLGVWLANLQSAAFDARMYSTAPPGSWVSKLITIAQQVRQRDLSPTPVLQAFRDYFVHHQSSALCGEAGSTRADAEEVRKVFNGYLAPDIRPIEKDEIAPASLDASAKIEDHLIGDKIQRLRGSYQHLRFGTEEQQAVNNLIRREDGRHPYLTDQERGTASWEHEALQFLNQLDTWAGEQHQPGKDLFHQKCTWYTSLLDIVPDGQLKTRILEQYLAFLSGSPIQRQSPPEWLWWVQRLLRMRDVKDRSVWLAQVAATGNPTISAYARLACLTASCSMQ